MAFRNPRHSFSFCLDVLPYRLLFTSFSFIACLFLFTPLAKTSSMIYAGTACEYRQVCRLVLGFLLVCAAFLHEK
jgi:hypothetical protein